MDNIEKLETKCSKLQNDIALLEKRMGLIDVGKKSTSKNDKSELRLNSLEIKQLRMEVEELQLRLKRQQLSELNLLQNALKEKWMENDARAKSAKEIFQMVESRVLELNNKSCSLAQNLKFLECTLSEKSKNLNEMTESCRESDMTEVDVIQYIHCLEIEYAKAIKNVNDSEDARNKLKYLLENLQKKNYSHYKLLMSLKGGTEILEEKDTKQEETNSKTGSDKEILLKSLEEKISLIRDATGLYDIKDIDFAFLEQKQISGYLNEMIRKLEKRLLNLKTEKREIMAKAVSVKEGKSLYPNSEEDLSLARSRLREQKLRLDAAESELKRLSLISNSIKSTLGKIVVALKPKAKKLEAEANICHLARELEKFVVREIKK